METIGEKIKGLRKRENISQETMAFDIGVSRQTIHKWENDIMQPNADNLKALGDYFNVDLNYFFNDNNGANDNELAISTVNKKSNKYLVCCSVIAVIVFLMFAFSLAFTIGTGLIAFTDNRSGHDYVVLLDAGAYIFYLFLSLSVILLVIEIIIIFCIKFYINKRSNV